MKGLADYVEKHRSALPPIIWMDTPPQHFDAPLGEFPNGKMPYTCAPLKGWYSGNAVLAAGGNYNRAAAKHLPRFAAAHLQTWNASVPLYDSHKPGECTHWCSPGAYHLWLYLLNNVRLPAGQPGGGLLRMSRRRSSAQRMKTQTARASPVLLPAVWARAPLVVAWCQIKFRRVRRYLILSHISPKICLTPVISNLHWARAWPAVE